MVYHDTHFHLDLFPRPELLVEKIEASKIYTIAVTNSPIVFFHTKQLAKDCKYVRPSLGLHPELAFERHKEITQFIDLIDQTRYIGEVGLDNQNKSTQDYEMQKSVFEKIVRTCADKREKILTIHSRKAVKDVNSIIGSSFPGKIILHWYSGGIKDLETALDYGFYFSINYPMTQSNSGQKIIEALPPDRMLIETDGPFVEYMNEPATPLLSNIIVKEVCKIKSNTEIKMMPEDFQNNFRTLIS
jgi:TatD DNase family protein